MYTQSPGRLLQISGMGMIVSTGVSSGGKQYGGHIVANTGILQRLKACMI
jgi:hypothetical protein